MNSPFPWPGGKRNLKKTLLTLLPEHELYVEVFCGSAKLFFAKQPAPREVINDLNGDVANFFRVVKHRAAELAEMFDREMVHPERFRELRHSDDAACELARAFRFAYLVWYSYGAKGQHFGSSNAKNCLASPAGPRPSLDALRDLLTATSLRLRQTLIEQRDFADILVRYDSPKTFFYLDPPYVHFGGVGHYGPMAVERREQLFGLLATRQANWLMSFDDCAEVRDLARRHRFHVRKVSVAYTLANVAGARHARGEVLITKAA
jgi:DNA adenine methylase